MKKNIIILILLLNSVSFAQNLTKMQDNSCGTAEATEEEMEVNFYYGNNDKLKQKYDSLAAIYGNVSNNPNCGSLQTMCD